jgi:hypothetical protein
VINLSKGSIVGYWIDGSVVCIDCAEIEDNKYGIPIFLKEAADQDLECDECFVALEELSYSA